MRTRDILWGLVALVLPAASVWAQHATPDEVRAAIGPIESLSPQLQRAYTTHGDFDLLPKPGEDDWLSVNPEPGQTFLQFVQSQPSKPSAGRNVIYIQPLDPFHGRDTKALTTLRTFAQEFFQLPTTMQPPIDVTQFGITERKNPHTKQRQLLTTDILDYLRGDMPRDSYCRLGITTLDLYPEPSWNFVFGQASLSEGTGVYSFARYEPAFYGEAPKPGDDTLALLRSFKVLAHETGHMFGIEHCVYLRCVMNGSNNMDETDASPVHLCPVCLRKLQHSLGFNIVDRYRHLELIYRQAGLEEERDWVRKRADFVGDQEL